MNRLGLATLRAYLGFFALFAHDRAHARREHSLIEGSLRESYLARRRAGDSHARSVRLAAREHLSELSPVTLVRKTRTDATFAPHRGGPRRWPELLVLAFGALLLVAVWRNRGDGDPVLVGFAAAAAAAGVAFLFSVIRAVRRSAGGSAIALALGLAVWPQWDWGYVMGEGLLALAIVVALLMVMVVRRHRRSGIDGLVLFATAPVVLHLLRELHLGGAALERVLGMSRGEGRGIELMLGLALYLILITFGLRLIGRHASTEHGPKAAA